MIGGRFKSASVASIAAAGLFMGGVAAQAADLGGNCCADLEERVAELEATTARKGNRKVSLEVSGHINEAVMFWDDGNEDNIYITTNTNSRSRFRFKGSAKINADWSAGFLMEIGARQTGNSAANDAAGQVNTGLDIRHQALYLKSNSLGTVWLGHTSIAIDGIADICLGCTMNSTTETVLSYGGFKPYLKGGKGYAGVGLGALGAGNNVGSGASRRDVIRYISPTFAGFVVSADAGGDDQWSAALRYAGEFGGIRVAGGVGYGEDTELAAGTVVLGEKAEIFGASLSFQHVPSGIFVAGSYGQRVVNNVTLAQGSDETNEWSVIAGIGQKLSSLGTTTIWGRYGEQEGGYVKNGFTAEKASTLTVAGVIVPGTPGVGVQNSEFTVISAGINQTIDAAAMDLYVTYYNVTGDVTSGDVKYEMRDFNAVMAGAIIRF